MSPLATILALITILLWSFQAFLGASLSQVPPFLLVGIAFCVSGLISAVRIRSWRVNWTTLVMGVGGIFGYNLFYFFAFQHAPAIEASLLNYLWPLLIVVLSPVFLAGYRLRRHHLVGAVIGLAGAALIVTGGHFALDRTNLTGYMLATGAALTWASYSLLTKRVRPFSNAAVGGFCLISGVLSLATHLVFEPLYLPSGREWFLLFLLGAGPLGAAYFTWDAAMKKGDPRIIGSLSYLTPLTSTLVLVALGGQEFRWTTGLAMILIVTGALTGSLDLIFSRKRRRIPDLVEPLTNSVATPEIETA
jgi:drug/metabolite transporter (DMT)-like permease